MAKAKKQEAEADAEAGDEAPKKGCLFSKQMIIMAVGGLLVVGRGGFGAMKFMGGHGDEHEEPQEEVVQPATFVDLPDVLVNLANSGSDRTQYLKVKVVLELPDAEQVPKIQPLMPRVMDAYQPYLRELRPTDLDGS